MLPFPRVQTLISPPNLTKQDNSMESGHTLPSIDTPVLLGRTFISDPDVKEIKSMHESRGSNHLEPPPQMGNRNTFNSE